MDRDKIRRVVHRVRAGDIALLAEVVEWREGGEGDPDASLAAALRRMRDGLRGPRLAEAVRGLSSDEIRWLVENGEELRVSDRRARV